MTDITQKGFHFTAIAWHTIVPVVAQKHASQPLSYRRYAVVKPSPKFRLQFLQLPLDSFPHSSAVHDKLAVSGPSAAMGKPQKITEDL